MKKLTVQKMLFVTAMGLFAATFLFYNSSLISLSFYNRYVGTWLGLFIGFIVNAIIVFLLLLFVLVDVLWQESVQKQASSS